MAKNIVRTRTGRALQAIRDRDVAAEIMGVPEVKYKLIAFAISSFFAGIAGAVYASFIGQLSPEDWDLLLSVEFIAIILIGGAGSVAGTLLGVFFVVLLPRHLELFVHWMSDKASKSGFWGDFWGFFVSTGGNDFGFVSDGALAPGFALPSSAAPRRSLRCPDHRLPALRAPRALRHLGQDPQLLEGVAIHVLTTTAPSNRSNQPQPQPKST